MKRNQSTALVRRVSSSLRLSLAFGVVGVFASVGSAASTAKDTYYVNDHLATTVATADASGEIAQIEADAFGTQTGPVAKDSRFTGKPYDADMGAYVFPFRNYRSDEARWMSADPSGFPDGPNMHYYAASPTRSFDRMGLDVINSSGLDWLLFSHYIAGSGSAYELTANQFDPTEGERTLAMGGWDNTNDASMRSFARSMSEGTTTDSRSNYGLSNHYDATSPVHTINLYKIEVATSSDLSYSKTAAGNGVYDVSVSVSFSLYLHDTFNFNRGESFNDPIKGYVSIPDSWVAPFGNPFDVWARTSKTMTYSFQVE